MYKQGKQWNLTRKFSRKKNLDERNSAEK